MIIELITPLMIATAPIQIKDVEPFKYDHASQQVVQGEFTTAQKQVTFNGTQTYDFNGRPKDADND
jgi:hypothetical protein